MDISVIIPTYQPKEYLSECLDSLYNQTLSFDKFEVILVLNGPKEPYNNYLQTSIKKYDKHFTISIIVSNLLGVSNARNTGIDAAKGNLLCFIDDDDIVSDSYLKELSEAHCKGCVVVSNVISFEDNIKNIQKDYLGEAFKNLKDKPFNLFEHRKLLSSACCKVIDKNIIANRRFSLKHKVGEDSLFMATISDKITDIKFTSNNAIYYRRIRKGSASRQKKTFKEKIKQRLPLVVDYIQLYLKNYPNYSFKFMLSRIVATFIHLLK
ncbi:glycosyltransferase family 2 protein [Tenacibaculum piscium]|uniref:Glycosyltransferase group 2 family protein n=1 Tax=Tenacibaculum piscium TaxID=1458515 RepID=A0A2H1YHM6_9FLAO|nr:glycosyltransferase family A protein [Tenacibaculum piscium]MBE7629134.1 glycosyltransferase [Tenacibaculum piscium]MBE7670577.1 glycosyltransferase [Tenacibaculum piscium]MBE7684843.1 glycosyltransferase [Tenacibaculum piscium]MBE7689546.1 glycosyltransferase [Tenacibaculum piscium]MCG8183412.1 glycosyltransferase family 2 protein [Tenacibaculum piscium]